MPLPVQGKGLSSPAGFEEVLLTSWRAALLGLLGRQADDMGIHEALALSAAWTAAM